ncbi:DNA-binding response regulator, OmpR family, contains REC and winged-helix (wHTH) domain [Pseudomonas citronellolis]|uniref:DNA-binding response regulator, OmpR family, contains REC and winged-helix (WHTH) domain n=1 Tax=Pseudomonas citronellolis TaxID=53408 RepID=A0AAQ1KDB3_9PSED|nr:two-component system response regulator GltR [Pseudomonas citronellolis]MCP1642747.1 DNA-binding response OmpR family regulator [Pseudomonas citronellolis]MCP1665671.1 DNA-binding response OmpR family regulator [Pseudomonas citronellolis]MCP1696581.1 DNA-binding response OmpR family regulator [Pseudomonas citronellolis]MCP1703227.1 DNA-binding response OmpR family regulator [Pseudomonas citronellolis]MCP1797334.1 DNA-binding response OmpR family regulator [Pseudomonas citronellolis]
MNAPAKSILLVDDDQEIRELLETYLSRAGFQVRSAADGAAFRQALLEEEAALAILDVMLPDEDGFSLCRWIRSHQRLACMPVIMLTASSDETDRVIGLELGADDYLGKPFSPRELLARIKALLRRAQFTQVRGGEVLAFDDWRLDTVSHRLFHEDGEEFFLSGADFALLKLFLDHPQQILDRDTIANATRGREVLPLERIVDMAVSRLRQRLRDTGKAPRLIQTVRGSGYLLAAQVRPHLGL